MAVFSQPVVYLGIRNVYLRTYTTTYPFLNAGWTWVNNSLQPMEWSGHYLASNNNIVSGFDVQLIDLQTGYTQIHVGDTGGDTINANNNFAPLTWANDSLAGFIAPDQGHTLTPFIVSYPATPDGGSHSYPLGGSKGPVLPVAANTTFPFGLMNWLAGDNSIVADGIITLQTQFYSFRGYAGGVLFTQVNEDVCDCHFEPVIAIFNNLIPFDGLSYCWVQGLSGGAMPFNIIRTNFIDESDYITCVFENPAQTTVDFQTLYANANNSGDFTATFFGMLAIYNDQIVVDGVTLNGYAIAVAPDFLSYEIINFVGLDNLAVNWSNHLGTPAAKIDRTGAIWIKQRNNDSTLFVGTRSIPSNVSVPPELTPLTQAINLPVNPGLYR